MSNIIAESMEAYQSRKALSAGMAWKIVNECPLLAWHESPFNPDYQTRHALEFDIGEAAHLAILEPEELRRRCEVVPADNYHTKAAKELRDLLYEQGKVPLLRKHCELVYKIGQAIESQCDLFRDGTAEATYTWQWEGVPCKARVDYIANRRPQGMLLVDLKTAASASPAAFQRAMVRDGHHLRAAWYLDGYMAGVSTEPARYRYVVVSKDEPHIVSEFEVDERATEWGRRLYRRALATFRQCMKSGIWPGYVEKVAAVGLPSWSEYQLADMEISGLL